MTTEERIGRLERINRRLSLAVLGLVVIFGATLTAGAVAPPGMIDASGFRIFDGDGQVCATLLNEGDVTFLSIGKEGSSGVTIGVSKSGMPSVSVQGKNKTSVATVMVDDNDQPCLFLETKNRFISVDRRGVTREAR